MSRGFEGEPESWPHADDPEFENWLRTLDLEMCMSARKCVAGGFDWLDKDLSGVLEMDDLVEFAKAMWERDPDKEKASRSVLYAMATGTEAERSIADGVTKKEWMIFWDGTELANMDKDQLKQAQSNMDMTMMVMKEALDKGIDSEDEDEDE